MDLENVENLTFGELIKAFRLRAKLTQAQFAEKLEKKRRSIIDWEAGSSRPQTKGDLLAIANIVKLSEEETTLLLKAGGQDPTPFAWNLPYTRNPYFTAREATLSHLTNELQQAPALSTSQPVALNGLGVLEKPRSLSNMRIVFIENMRPCFGWRLPVVTDGLPPMSRWPISFARQRKMPKNRIEQYKRSNNGSSATAAGFCCLMMLRIWHSFLIFSPVSAKAMCS